MKQEDLDTLISSNLGAAAVVVASIIFSTSVHSQCTLTVHGGELDFGVGSISGNAVRRSSSSTLGSLICLVHVFTVSTGLARIIREQGVGGTASMMSSWRSWSRRIGDGHEGCAVVVAEFANPANECGVKDLLNIRWVANGVGEAEKVVHATDMPG